MARLKRLAKLKNWRSECDLRVAVWGPIEIDEEPGGGGDFLTII